MFVRAAEAAAKIEDSVVVLQRESAEELFQLLKAIADVRRVEFVGFCVSLVQLIQDGFAIAITGVKGVGSYVGIQPFCNFVHISTPLHQ